MHLTLEEALIGTLEEAQTWAYEALIGILEEALIGTLEEAQPRTLEEALIETLEEAQPRAHEALIEAFVMGRAYNYIQDPYYRRS
jgi:hypothetical protein